MNLTQELTALALLSPQSISAPAGSVPTIQLPSGGTLQAQLGAGAVRDGAQARLVTLAELPAVPGGDPLPLVIWETAGPEAAADVLDSIPAAAVSGAWAEDPAQVHAFYTRLFRFELAHVGINLPSDQEAFPLADCFASIFGMEQAVGPLSVFCGGTLELMRTPGRGEHGHLALRTSHLERAMAYVQRQGLELDMAHAMYRGDGLLMGAYFKESFGGFALHLLRRV